MQLHERTCPPPLQFVPHLARAQVYDEMSASPELLKKIPLFGDLSETEIAEIVSCFTKREFKAGDQVFKEGDPATNACFVVEGEFEVLKALPGGGQVKVGEIPAGAMVGEMALISDGARTATVRAKEQSTVVNVSYHFFHAALDQMSTPAFKILRAIIRIMAGRLNNLHSCILDQWDCEPFIGHAGSGTTTPTASEPSFDFLPFLQVLPCFKPFGADEIETVLKLGTIFEVPRGEILLSEGVAPESCFLILRGAIGRSIVRDRSYQFSVLGPGRLCGANALINDTPNFSDARVMSQALLLALDKQAFETLFRMQNPACLKFQNLVSLDQLIQLREANNLYSILDYRNQIHSHTPHRNV